MFGVGTIIENRSVNWVRGETWWCNKDAAAVLSWVYFCLEFDAKVSNPQFGIVAS